MRRHLSNLPAEVTSFVGRRTELRELKRLLGTTRLLTLTGSGGVGKTKLAIGCDADIHVPPQIGPPYIRDASGPGRRPKSVPARRPARKPAPFGKMKISFMPNERW